MKTVSFTEFRKNASNYFSAVEKGEVFVVIRHGKPIAEIRPAAEGSNKPSWKELGLRLSVKGLKLSSAILEEREREGAL